MLWTTSELWILKDRQTACSDTKAGEEPTAQAGIREAEPPTSPACGHLVCNWNKVIPTWNDLHEVHRHGSLLLHSWKGNFNVYFNTVPFLNDFCNLNWNYVCIIFINNFYALYVSYMSEHFWSHYICPTVCQSICKLLTFLSSSQTTAIWTISNKLGTIHP